MGFPTWTFTVKTAFTPIPWEIREFVTEAARPGRVTIYTDIFSKLVHVPMIWALTQTKIDYGGGATGVYVSPANDRPALALQLTTPLCRATNAYYQKIMGIVMGALMAQHMAFQIKSDCQSAIRRFRNASNPVDFSVGQLHAVWTSTFCGIRRLMLKDTEENKLQWTESQPEKIKPCMNWTADNQDIYMADLVARELVVLHTEKLRSQLSLLMLMIFSALLPQKAYRYEWWSKGF